MYSYKVDKYGNLIHKLIYTLGRTGIYINRKDDIQIPNDTMPTVAKAWLTS